MSSTTTTSGSKRARSRRGFAGLAAVLVAIILCALLPANADAKAHQRPLAPASVKVLPIGQSRFHLSWDDVRRAVGYHVYNSGRLVGRVRRTGFTTAPLRRTGVHVYTVRSVSRRGVLSQFGRIVRIVVTPVSHDSSAPGVPRLRPMDAAPTSRAPQLSWTAVRDAGGSGVAGYRISRDGRHIASTRGTSFVDYSAESGVHVYTVSAYDHAGNVSRESAPQVAGRDVIAPATPAPTAESPTQGAPAISWPAVADDGSGVAVYQVRRDGRTIGSTAATSFTDEGLSAAGWHTYTVRALDRAGNASPWSDPLDVRFAPPGTDISPPSAPRSLDVSLDGNSATVTWDAATDEGGVTGYDVYANGVKAGTETSRTQHVFRVACGRDYTFGVVAFDAAGNRSDMATVTATTADCPAQDTTAPSDPGDLQVALTGSSATLTWQDSTDDTAVVGYDVYAGGAKVATEAAASHVFAVSCGRTYAYGVVAFDLAGNRSHMSTVSVQTPACPAGDTAAPSKPSGLDVTVSGGSAWLSWSASTDNVGVTGYDVYAGGSKLATEVVTSHIFTVSCGHTYTLGVVAFDAAGNRSAMATSSITTAACPSGDVFNVNSYGAKGDGSSNDSAAFARAIAAASAAGSSGQPGVVYVPRATYALANVSLRSNVTVNVEAGTTMRIAAGATGNSAIFYLGNYASGEASWIDNVTVTGVNGTYTMDVARSDAPRGHGFTIKNVRHFEVSNVQGILSNSATSGLPPSSQAAFVTFHSTPASKLGGTLYHPVDGLIKNVSVTNAPYGYGTTQVTAGEALDFENISSTGGIALRMETDGNSDVLDGVEAHGITCRNGHSAVSFSPHDQDNNDVHVYDVTAVSCSEGVRVAGNPAAGDGGTFANSTVTGATIVHGLFAQNPAGSLGAWRIGPSDDCVNISSTAAYKVTMTGVSCQGF
jgi:hypothetical protein